MNVVGNGEGVVVGAGISPAAIPFASAELAAIVIVSMLKMFDTDPRCVNCAPFGKPVVPDV
jgi:hypothetical protein